MAGASERLLEDSLENGMPLKWELVSPGLACFHGNLDEVNELLLLITSVCVCLQIIIIYQKTSLCLIVV